MRFAEPLIQTVGTQHTPESLVRHLASAPGVLLLSAVPSYPHSVRGISLVVARPFLRFRSWGSRCELSDGAHRTILSGNPWEQFQALWTRYAQPNPPNHPFPLGGCFGLWGYGLKHFVEPRLTRRTRPGLGLPDCDLGFYHSLVVFDPEARTARIVATGLESDGSRSASRAGQQASEWHRILQTRPTTRPRPKHCTNPPRPGARPPVSSFSRETYLQAVARALTYIRSGDIYQVNLAQRLTAPAPADPYRFFERLQHISPAPFSAWYDAGDYQLASASPELFLRLEGARIVTRPIKGTRPRDPDPELDAQWSEELRSSPKERAELLMITDLMRNDLGRVCEYGSVTVPELMRLEPFAQVHHLVATIEGQLRRDVTHPQALAACFPGGSVTGAPKIRAMEIIDELEPVSRGPYTGALGYLGFNQQSQLSMVIRSAIFRGAHVHFPVGAGIVADSDPAAEYDETLVKARAFLMLLENPEGRIAGTTPRGAA